ncbi:hypothetical protein HUU05_23335 [candidate division KSB1 bacterium]|nr:hypothetical protein [candidate division KSB1 bacterium]
MVRRFSTALGSTTKAFKKAGVFDGFIEVDTKLYIDPHLLSISEAPEIKDASEQFRRYFMNIINMLKHATSPQSAFWRQARRKLEFHEISQLSLGYSKDDTRGNAIGKKLAAAITKTAREIVQAGIDAPEVFELIGVLEEGIGADRISDMTAAIIAEYLLRYSQRIASELGLSTKKRDFQEKTYRIPFDKQKARFVILVPSDILRKLPIAHDWGDIDVVCMHNETLRRKVNQIIGRTWRDATRKITKRDLRSALLSQPEALRDLIEQYKAKTGSAYDFQLDPDGEILWHETAQQYVSKYPLDLSQFQKVSADNVFAIVQSICDRFKQLVERNGLHQLFYNDKGRLKHERAVQLLFFGIADAYCEANNLDLSREPNAGSGPVDFKISRGYRARVNVEIKYSSNSNLENGYSTQLLTYNQAEKTQHSILLIIQTGNHERKLNKLQQLKHEAISGNKRAPEIVTVDGRRSKSASRLKAVATE